jgi:hypothetical protein
LLQAYIDALAKCLMEGAEDPSTPAHARMCELIKAMVGFQVAASYALTSRQHHSFKRILLA